MTRNTITGTRPVVVWGVVAIIVILILGLVVGLAVIYPGIQADREATRATAQTEAEIQRHYQAGMAFEVAEEWEAARAEYMQVIVLDPGYRDAQSRLTEVKGSLAEGAGTSTAVAIAMAEQAQATAQAEGTAQAQCTAAAQSATAVAATSEAKLRATDMTIAQVTAEAAPTATAAALEVRYQRALGLINLEQWSDAQAELEYVFNVDPNFKDVQAQLAEVKTKVAESLSANTSVSPTPMPTSTQVATRMPSSEERHPGEVNLLEANQELPAKWFTNGEFTYWEGFLHVQDEPFIDITVGNCGDNEGNSKLDIIQIFYPDGSVALNERDRGGDPKFRIRTYQKPGYYRIFLQDKDTGRADGNGGQIEVEMLKDQKIYLDIPQQ